MMSPMHWSAAGWLVISLLLALPVLAQPIDEAEVQIFLDTIETALRDRDIGAVGDSLAPSVSLHFVVRSNEGDETVSLDRDSYIRSIGAVLGSVSDYQFSVTVDEILIENQGQQARIRLTVRERLIWPDREQHSTTMETVVVERIDGKLRATEVRGVVLMDEGLQEVHMAHWAPG